MQPRPELISGEFYWIRVPMMAPFIAEYQADNRNRYGHLVGPCFWVDSIREVIGEPEVLAHIKRPEV